MSRPLVLQLCPFSAWLEAGLAERGDVVRWFELDAAAQETFLAGSAADVRAVATGGHLGIPRALAARLPMLQVIAINGVGVDKVDLAAARERGVAVGNTPDVLTDDVADLAVGLVIALLRGIPAGDAHVRAGAWPQGERPLGRQVSGRRFGIVGLGRIGVATARRLAPFGPVAWTGPAAKPGVPWPYVPEVRQLARDVDVLVLTCPANAATHHLVGAAVLDALGPAGYLVNVARGAVVDEAALVDALSAGRLAGAALDVFEDEPRVPAALRDSPRVVLTPHVASATVETRTRMADLVLANLDAGLAGRPLPAGVVQVYGTGTN